MDDRFARYPDTLMSQARRHFAIVPDDGADLPELPKAIYVNAAGTVVLRDEAGHDETYDLTEGQILPFRPVRVLATGTTASLIGWA